MPAASLTPAQLSLLREESGIESNLNADLKVLVDLGLATSTETLTGSLTWNITEAGKERAQLPS
ncbi:hypothetical protein HNP46_000071 [Pseudomonas nitritireducens]|uniref:Uncharacterized protein n=1 Tax=Pseudomonas nitroreducens TaxID=46680 RepID=A0A7W7NZG2_PSENT|nr:hypothetical protein [Pseudomonas nitritireducens]MBB4861260.1 hypothetical protein [Pseudomonas nitritireducens]